MEIKNFTEQRIVLSDEERINFSIGFELYNKIQKYYEENDMEYESLRWNNVLKELSELWEELRFEEK